MAIKQSTRDFFGSFLNRRKTNTTVRDSDGTVRSIRSLSNRNKKIRKVFGR